MFRIIVPLNENYSYDKSADKTPESADKMPISAEKLLEVKERRARNILNEMIQIQVLAKQGSHRSTIYIVCK